MYSSIYNDFSVRLVVLIQKLRRSKGSGFNCSKSRSLKVNSLTVIRENPVLLLADTNPFSRQIYLTQLNIVSRQCLHIYQISSVIIPVVIVEKQVEKEAVIQIEKKKW